MRSTLLLSTSFLIISTFSFSQHFEPCITHQMWEESCKQHPEKIKAREQYEQDLLQIQARKLNQPQKQGTPYIIPVVVHVIHEGGAENISRAQIVDQLDSLTKDFRRLNGDAANTPAVWQSVAADANVEFRLAQLDPNGNCTDGVVRVFSHLTNGARNNVKALSYWPSNKYLNIWTVKSIENTSGAAGIIIGFAQFPGPLENPLTDGVVVRHDYFGSIGTAASSGYNGRTTTHEVGHWLNLRHIWGDDGGACSGSDLVGDTPNQADNSTGCPSFPKTDGCSTVSPGVMYPNYMDYTDGDCQNMFSAGQVSRMDATLNSAVSGRNNLWSMTNLILTGTDGTPPVLCAPIADFPPEPIRICEGVTVNFTDGTWNGAPASWNWNFPGGNPSSSTSQNPSINYPVAGIYDVQLIATNATGSDTLLRTGHVIVSPANVTLSVPFAEGFENAFPPSDWFVFNEYPSTNTWTQTTLASFSGSNSARIFNYTNQAANGVDDLITTAFNLSNVSQTQMTFQLAFALKNASATDQLRVLSSTNCGQLWAVRYNKSGTNLQTTTGAITANFTPNSSQWRLETVNLSSTSVSGRPNVRFKFEYRFDNGNNLYLDDINLTGLVGMEEVNVVPEDYSVYPNPSSSMFHVSFSLLKNEEVSIEVTDAFGRIVQRMQQQQLGAGEYDYQIGNDLSGGVYLVSLKAGSQVLTKKIVIY